MSRPRLVSVDVTSRPPQMTLCWPGEPPHYITVRLRTNVQSAGLARAAAQTEIAALGARDLELLRECATPGPALDIGNPALFESAVRPVQRVAAPAGIVVRCPSCATKIGTTDSPSLGYMRECTTCHREIDVQVRDGWIIVAMREAPSE
jgi:hypothetical protein